MVLDDLAARKNKTFKPGPGRYEWLKTTGSGHGTIFIKPMTYMNRSGIAVSDARLRLQIPLNRCLVLLDDIALPIGKIRLRAGGSDGGHNGLASVISYLHSREVPRLRLGIGDGSGRDIIHHVLSPFSFQELDSVRQMISRAVETIENFTVHDIHDLMNVVNKSS
jgi:peptidyl-tRNA hydrolase, PTH1 family